MNEADYQILGLKPDADIDSVKHRYEMLLRLSLRDETMNIEEITAAYDRIIDSVTVDYFNPDADLLNQKGFNMKKFKNFIFQKKLVIGIVVWILIGIVFLIILVFKPESGNYTPDIAPF